MTEDGRVLYTVKLDGWAGRRDGRVLYTIKAGRVVGFHTLSSWTVGRKTVGRMVGFYTLSRQAG